jgi:hypothetical protein
VHLVNEYFAKGEDLMADLNNQNEMERKLTPEEDEKETQIIKESILFGLYKNGNSISSEQSEVPKKTRKKRAPNNDGVKIPGICPYCGSKLRTKADKYGYKYTVCEKYNERCSFYFPQKKSHF